MMIALMCWLGAWGCAIPLASRSVESDGKRDRINKSVLFLWGLLFLLLFAAFKFFYVNRHEVDFWLELIWIWSWLEVKSWFVGW